MDLKTAKDDILIKKFQLRVITENQKSRAKAEKLAKILCITLECEPIFTINKYHELQNSYDIIIIATLKSPDNSVYELIELAHRITGSWRVGLDRERQEVALVFVKNVVLSYTVVNFNVINWAELYVV